MEKICTNKLYNEPIHLNRKPRISRGLPFKSEEKVIAAKRANFPIADIIQKACLGQCTSSYCYYAV